MVMTLKKLGLRRLSLTLLILCISPLASVVGNSSADEAPTTRQVVLSTDTVPSGGAIFGDLRPPSVNAQGAIAFEDGFGNGIYTTAHGRAVKPLIRAVGMGDSPPGVLGNFGGIAEPSLNDDGSFVFRGFGADSSNRGIFLLASHGGPIVFSESTVSTQAEDSCQTNLVTTLFQLNSARVNLARSGERSCEFRVSCFVLPGEMIPILETRN